MQAADSEADTSSVLTSLLSLERNWHSLLMLTKSSDIYSIALATVFADLYVRTPAPLLTLVTDVSSAVKKMQSVIGSWTIE